MNYGAGLEAAAAIAAVREAQPGWAAQPVRQRLAVIRATRKLLARQAGAFAGAAARPNMTEAELLLAEVMPLLAACRFLEQRAESVLAVRRPAGARPPWLFGTSLRVRRVPFGSVLILGPGNYPLFLPGVQALQALVAGNGVLLKPAPGCAPPMTLLAEALARAGLPDGLFRVLPDTHAAGADALAAGADKVVLTGSSDTGRRVLRQLAETATPATLELSGNDAVLVLPGTPIATAARAIAYGLRLNGGQTCIAPRRILAVGEAGPALAAELDAVLRTLPAVQVELGQAALLQGAFAAACDAGGRVLGEASGLGASRMSPLVLLASDPSACLPPLFAPAATMLLVPDAATAALLANADAHALGAAVFGPAPSAAAVARGLRAGCVVVNDMIAPTADPRLPFAGAGRSGFGVTRGAEGLLEMTRPQALIARRQPLTLPYRPLPPDAARWIERGLRWLYG